MKSTALKIMHREEAEARKIESDKLTPAQRIENLDKLGLTATRERTRLQKIIDAAKVQDAPTDGESVKDANNNAQNARKDKAAKHNKEIATK